MGVKVKAQSPVKEAVDNLLTEANENALVGMACPTCESEGPFYIDVNVTVEVSDEGVEDYGDVMWEDAAACTCKECGHMATVKDFEIDSQQKLPREGGPTPEQFD